MRLHGNLGANNKVAVKCDELNERVVILDFYKCWLYMEMDVHICLIEAYLDD